MTELYIYLIKAATLNAFILGFYYFILRKSNWFNLMRFILIMAIILPLLLPLIPINKLGNEPSITSPLVIPINIPDTYVVDTPTQTDSFISTIDLPGIIYYVITLMFLVGIIISVTAIIKKRIQSTPHITNFGRVELDNTNKNPFSFFSWVFISPQDLEHPELEMLLKHEFCHVNELHSLDKLLAAIFRSILWFSPGSYLTSRLLTEVHEYQADAKVVRTFGSSSYSNLILSYYLKPWSLSTLSNNFSLHIKKRINMINNLSIIKLSYKKIAIGTVILLSSISIISMIAPYENSYLRELSDHTMFKADSIESDTIRPSLVANLEWIAAFEDEKIKGLKGDVLISLMINPDGSATDIHVVKSAGKILDEFSLNVISKIKTWQPAYYQGKPVVYKLLFPFKFDGEDQVGINGPLTIGMPDTVKKVVKSTSANEDQPDIMAQFPGGDKARIEYVNSNLVYPEEAIKAGIEGTVFVQFTVTTLGEITNPRVMRGVAPSLDKASIQLIDKMPKWTPAMKDNKPVPFEMVMPIKFTLSDKDKRNAAKELSAEDKYSKFPTEARKIEGTDIYSVPDIAPEFPGGQTAFEEYFKNNAYLFEKSRERGLEGRIYVSFVIKADGSVSNAKIMRGMGEELDKIALGIVNNMPKWTPGKVNGENVDVIFTIPVGFKLPRE